MNDNINFYNMSELEAMIVAILSDSQDIIWKELEEEKNPLIRCKNRKIFALAVNKINERNIK